VQRFSGTYRQRQVECAAELYGSLGVARADLAGRQQAMLRNFQFFGAPHVAIVCMEAEFGLPVALDVGAYIQTLMLALWARGVASCPQVSLRQVADPIRRELGIADNLQVLCGMSIGYEDGVDPANRTRQARQPLEENVTFLD
jgi:nitroreductase